MNVDEKFRRIATINQTFTPSAPVNSRSLFAGRSEQIESVIGAVYQRGQHAMLYGERGVGKTSLSNIIGDLMVLAFKENVQIAKYTCGQTTTLESMWNSLLKQLTVERDSGTLTLDQLMTNTVGSEEIREIFQQLDSRSVIVIDELDTIVATDIVPILADTIKTLSDHSVDTTLILVGVADSVEELIAEHQSIERALLQVQMPRMSVSELAEIIDKGLDSSQADMTIDDAVKGTIAKLSQGLPNYTHLLARHAAIEAVEQDRTHIAEADLKVAITKALANQQQTIKSAYHKATNSPRENLYKDVLLACALAPVDELGYFNAGAIREPMRMIKGNRYEIPAFSKHLNDFCNEARGPILDKKGVTKRFRFRFRGPMMPPYVLLKGLSDGLIEPAQIHAPDADDASSEGISA